MNFSSPQVLILFLVILGIVAFLYASVGHGGASGYLGLMALFSFPTLLMKPTALLLNLFVSAIAFFFFRKHQHFQWKLFYPFALSSIPSALIGGYLSIDANIYKKILACLLIIAMLRMLNVFGRSIMEVKKLSLGLALFIGCIIGLFSGVIGIGGGIILSPLIIVLGIGSFKQAAAVSALFIFVNSLAGIVGFLFKGNELPSETLYLIPVVLIGGGLGAIYGSTKFNTKTLTYLLSFVLAIASIKLFLV